VMPFSRKMSDTGHWRAPGDAAIHRRQSEAQASSAGAA
jgi:hypothetical protein